MPLGRILLHTIEEQNRAEDKVKDFKLHVLAYLCVIMREKLDVRPAPPSAHFRRPPHHRACGACVPGPPPRRSVPCALRSSLRARKVPMPTASSTTAM